MPSDLFENDSEENESQENSAEEPSATDSVPEELPAEDSPAVQPSADEPVPADVASEESTDEAVTEEPAPAELPSEELIGEAATEEFDTEPSEVEEPAEEPYEAEEAAPGLAEIDESVPAPHETAEHPAEEALVEEADQEATPPEEAAPAETAFDLFEPEEGVTQDWPEQGASEEGGPEAGEPGQPPEPLKTEPEYEPEPFVKHFRLIMVIAVAVVIVAAGVIWFATRPKLPAPAQSVQEVLQLRRKQSTDVKAYARFFEATAVAEALAADVDPVAGSKIPEWEEPVVVRSTDTTAVVSVEWIPSARFKDWPESATFQMKKVKGKWVIVDAESSTEATTTPDESKPATKPAEHP